MNKKLDFLKSRRFWSLVAIGIIQALEAEGIIPGVLAKSLYTILGGFIGITTIDHFAKYLANVKNG